jgi:transcription elongation factor Elf1
MVIKVCPKCGANVIKIFTKYGYDVDFDIKNSNQNTICPNCKRKISYSVVKISKASM